MFKRFGRAAVACLVVPALALATAGCGDEGDDEQLADSTRVPTVDVAAGDPAAGNCSVTIAGDETLTIQGNGGEAAVASVHWFGEDEPEIAALLLNCLDRTDPGRSVVLTPSQDTTAEDVPMGPGSYPIPESDAGLNPGEFRATVNTGSARYNVSSAGTLEITSFDERGVAGTFSFVAREAQAEGEPGRISVTGRFDFACTGGESCEP